MANELNRIFLIVTTSTHSVAGSSADFQLVATKSGADFIREIPTRRFLRGRTDIFEFDVSNEGITTASELYIRMIDSIADSWLPSAIWAIGQLAGRRFGAYVVLGAHPVWDKGWFARGANTVDSDTHKISEDLVILPELPFPTRRPR